MGSLKSYFTLAGRLSAVQYWRLQRRLSLLFVIVFVVTIVATMAGGWLGAVPFVFAAPLLIASVCSSVRRLHDRGKSAWWLAVFTVVPALIVGFAEAGPESTAMLVLTTLSVPVMLGLVIWSWIEFAGPGQKGPNRYGPDPKAA